MHKRYALSLDLQVVNEICSRWQLLGNDKLLIHPLTFKKRIKAQR